MNYYEFFALKLKTIYTSYVFSDLMYIMNKIKILEGTIQKKKKKLKREEYILRST